MATIRCLLESDLGDCMRLKAAAGWNQTLADWRALLRCAPLGCFGIEEEGRVAATATAIVNGDVGWVGMVLTDPLFRGRGFATALLKCCLDYLDSRVKTVKLDASAEGEPLYRKLEFAEEAVIERWVCMGVAEGALATGSYTGRLRHADIPLDAVAECNGAWAGCRAGSSSWYFGPCYGLDSDSVEIVARALLAGRGRAYWDLFPSHAAAGVAGRLGFAPARRLLRMVRGRAAPTDGDVYAISGFEWG